MTKYTKERLDSAMNTMRDTVTRVERFLKHPKTTDAEAINKFIHEFTWGLANACNEVQSATLELGDALSEAKTK